MFTAPKFFPIVNKSDFASLLITQYPMDNTKSLAVDKRKRKIILLCTVPVGQLHCVIEAVPIEIYFKIL